MMADQRSSAQFAVESQDVELALRIASDAGELAMGRRGTGVAVTLKPDGSPVTDVELAIEDGAGMSLAKWRPDDSLLMEESGARKGGASRRWLIDPIDGTSAYVEGRDSWGVHVALEVDGVVTVGVVTRPARGMTWYGALGWGAYVARGRDQVVQQLAPQWSDAELRASGLVESPREVAEVIGRQGRWVNSRDPVIGEFCAGRVDLVMDIGGDPWDRAPIVPIVSEVGGLVWHEPGTNALEAHLLMYVAPWALKQARGICRELEEVSRGA